MTDTQATICAAIMAAGRSARFNSTKQVAELSGMPLVQHATTAARQICSNRVLTVLGHDKAAVVKALGSKAGFVVVNDDYKSGLGTSIATAVRVCRKDADAILLLLADQPLVTAEHLQALIDNWSGSESEIVATIFDDTQGPPVLFPSGTFDELSRLSGDKGARALFHDARFQLKTVRYEDAAVDIDTPADLAALT